MPGDTRGIHEGALQEGAFDRVWNRHRGVAVNGIAAREVSVIRSPVFGERRRRPWNGTVQWRNERCLRCCMH